MRSERLEEEAIPACGTEALPRLCGSVPDQSMTKAPSLAARCFKSGGGGSRRSVDSMLAMTQERLKSGWVRTAAGPTERPRWRVVASEGGKDGTGVDAAGKWSGGRQREEGIFFSQVVAA